MRSTSSCGGFFKVILEHKKSYMFLQSVNIDKAILWIVLPMFLTLWSCTHKWVISDHFAFVYIFNSKVTIFGTFWTISISPVLSVFKTTFCSKRRLRWFWIRKIFLRLFYQLFYPCEGTSLLQLYSALRKIGTWQFWFLFKQESLFVHLVFLGVFFSSKNAGFYSL